MRQLTSGSRVSGGKDFLGGLWDQPGEHNRQAEWLADVEDELNNVQQQEGFQEN